MLIPFPELISKYGINPEGIFHCGASSGQELEAYYNNGVKRSIWIEALPAAFEQLKLNCAKYPDALAIQACISYRDGDLVPFNISSNAGESSSMLEFGTHAARHPDVTYINSINLVTKTLTRIVSEYFINIDHYEFLNMDLQGCELMALQGMSSFHLDKIKYAYIEVNKDELYKGCARDHEIDAFLLRYHLIPMETRWAGDAGWGDRLYMRKD